MQLLRNLIYKSMLPNMLAVASVAPSLRSRSKSPANKPVGSLCDLFASALESQGTTEAHGKILLSTFLPASTVSPLATAMCLTTPSQGAATAVSIFMALSTTIA